MRAFLRVHYRVRQDFRVRGYFLKEIIHLRRISELEGIFKGRHGVREEFRSKGHFINEIIRLEGTSELEGIS